MDRVSDALTAIGGLAGIGAIIDFATSRAQKDRLRKALEHWWLVFDDIRWGNFGKKEAQMAVAILDRWAGPRFFTVDRWGFAFRVMVAVAIVSGIGTLAYRWLTLPDFLFRKGGNPWTSLFAPALLMPLSLVSFVAALSVNRAIAIFIGRLCRGTPLDGVLFLVLLIIHWLLLAYWSAVTFILLYAPWITLLARLNSDWSEVAEILYGMLRAQSPHLAGGWFPIPLTLSDGRPNPLDSTAFQGHAEAIADTYTTAMDLLSNGTRIGFSLIFLISFVFRPFIQRPISWLWYQALESGKPLFTMLCGAIGVVIKVGQWALS